MFGFAQHYILRAWHVLYILVTWLNIGWLSKYVYEWIPPYFINKQAEIQAVRMLYYVTVQVHGETLTAE